MLPETVFAVTHRELPVVWLERPELDAIMGEGAADEEALPVAREGIVPGGPRPRFIAHPQVVG